MARGSTSHDTDGQARLCARIYAIIAVPALIVMCLVVAPFQGSDEAAHFLRSIAISEGRLAPAVDPHDRRSGVDRPTAGGIVDDAAATLAARYPVALLRDTAHRVTPAEVRALMAIRAAGTASYAPHSNTAIYPPPLYAAPAVAVATARAAGLPVLGWLYAARFLGALAGGLILWACIRRAGDLAPLLLFVALTPILLFQLATITSDALLLPLSVVFALLVTRIVARRPERPGETPLLGLATVVVAAGKFAYLPLIVLPPLAARLADGRWSRRCLWLAAASLLALAAWAAWGQVIAGKVFTIRPTNIHVDVGEQLHFVLSHPVAAAKIFLSAMASQLPNMTIQSIGARISWYEVAMPGALIVPGIAVMLLGAMTGRPAYPRDRRVLALAALLALGCYALIYAAIYLQSNAVASPSIRGVQGRYFIPLLVLVLALTPRLRLAAAQTRVALAIVVLWCVASPVTTIAVLLNRYWAL